MEGKQAAELRGEQPHLNVSIGKFVDPLVYASAILRLKTQDAILHDL